MQQETHKTDQTVPGLNPLCIRESIHFHSNTNKSSDDNNHSRKLSSFTDHVLSSQRERERKKGLDTLDWLNDSCDPRNLMLGNSVMTHSQQEPGTYI